MAFEQRKVRKVADRFIEHELFQMFVVDKAIYIYILFTIAIMIYYIVTGKIQLNHIIYFVLIFVGGFICVIVQMSRLRNNEHLKKFNTAQIGIIVLNAGIVLIPIVLGLKQKTFTFAFVMEQFLVSMWENLTFFLIIPVILMYLFKFARTTSKRESAVTFGVIVFSAVLFGFAHWKAYAGNLLTIGYLIGIGILIGGLCYMFSPSLSISFHLLNNLMILIRMSMIVV